MLNHSVAPDLLDLLEIDRTGDLHFYGEYARTRGGPVLVLLSGTGRVAVSIARQGVPVLGIDPDGERIERARWKAMESGAGTAMFVRADPGRFVSHGRHRLALIPGGALQRLLSLEEQRQALFAVRWTLVSGGLLLLDLPLWHPGGEAAEEPARLWQDPEGGRSALVQRSRRFDSARQLIHETVTVEWLEPDGTVGERRQVERTERYSTPGEIELLLDRCGFTATLSGGFDMRPLLPGATRLVVEARCRLWDGV